ncbi:hypothetical protein ACFWGC_18425 [Cytobacillus pseudoceanisediminis]|uniref:hypothetical protein n=1 Tax=Cytobacillus pseudoceanisediminis TaxID=3051614 RepID=UPI00365D27D1
MLNYTKKPKVKCFILVNILSIFIYFFSQLYKQKSTAKAKEKLELEAMMDAALFGAGWLLPSAK